MKNEAHVLNRMLASVIDLVDGCVCVDTGSTDNSIEIVKEFFEKANKPCYIYEWAFVNFSDARNHALERIKGKADFGFWIDCDEMLMINKGFEAYKLKRQLGNFDLGQSITISGGSHYARSNFFRTSLPFKWKGAVHEYLSCDVPTRNCNVSLINTFVPNDGDDTKEKYKKHAEILLKEYNKNNDPRDLFYLAQSYKDAGERAVAIDLYRERARRTDGFYEERYYSQFMIGLLLQGYGQDQEAIFEYLKCSQLDSLKADHFLNIIILLQKNDLWQAAYIFSKLCMEQYHKKNPYPQRHLFIHTDTYDFKLESVHKINCKKLNIQPTMNIQEAYQYLHKKQSDINEHLPVLKAFAEVSEHLTEMGMRFGVSTHAFLAGKPKTIVSYDLNRTGVVSVIDQYAKDEGVNFKFIQGNTLELEIEPTDVLFIDTLHTYDQLYRELRLHSTKVKKTIILHDTTSFGYTNEFDAKCDGRGLRPAVERFLEEDERWTIAKVYENNNGLTILQRCTIKENQRVVRFPDSVYHEQMEILKLSLMGYSENATDFNVNTTYNNLTAVQVGGEVNAQQLPNMAVTMIGYKRLTNIEHCAREIFANKIEGDFVETGVWKGGACVLMAALIGAFNEKRDIYVCDSFEGLPKPDEKYPADAGDQHHTMGYLKISVDSVKESFERYGLLNEKVKFIKGWFSDTMIDFPSQKIALLRLDGDMYSSTWDVLTNLYDKVAIGGYIIVDDYGLNGCREAITDFRNEKGICDEISIIDKYGAYWKKSENKPVEIDVCIVSHAKTRELLEVTEEGIRSLLKSESNIKFNVFVVESNNQINYDSAFPNTKTIYTDAPFNYNHYLNLAFAAGVAKFTVLCNNDLTYEKGWASEILKAMKLYPNVESASPFCPQTQKKEDYSDYLVYYGYEVRNQLAGWCIFQKRDVLEKIGGLDESVDFWYSDNIYADQLKRAGIKHALISTSIVNHHENNIGKTAETMDSDKIKELTTDQGKKYNIHI